MTTPNGTGNLASKVAFVTRAGSGIGRAAAADRLDAGPARGGANGGVLRSP
jgi:hypothetical protein